MQEINRWAHLPNLVLSENQAVTGIRLPDGMIECTRCTRSCPDNSDRSRGLGPSCSHCWAGLDVVDHAGDGAVPVIPNLIIFPSSNRRDDHRAPQ